jgi:hypothetical protein
MLVETQISQEKNHSPLEREVDQFLLDQNIRNLKNLMLELVRQNQILTENQDLQKTVQTLVYLSTLEKLLSAAKDLAEKEQILALESLLAIAKDLSVEKISQNEEVEKLNKSLSQKEPKKEKISKPKKQVPKIFLENPTNSDNQLQLGF